MKALSGKHCHGFSFFSHLWMNMDVFVEAYTCILLWIYPAAVFDRREIKEITRI
jgi:hypothetical protein